MNFTFEEFVGTSLSPGAYMLLYCLVHNETDMIDKIVFVNNNKKELQEAGYIKLADDESIVLRQKALDLQAKVNPEVDFDTFWDKYHIVTDQRKSNLQPSIKYWNKLNKREKQLAIDNIEKYYNSLPVYSTGRPVKIARTYLRDKNFNDEFSYKDEKSSINKMI